MLSYNYFENFFYLFVIVFKILAGLPAATTLLGIDFVTIDPAPITVFSPIVTPGSKIVFAPIQLPFLFERLDRGNILDL